MWVKISEVNLIKKRKSQAGLEFVMTYGWALLVVMVAIVALASFGALNYDRYVANKCTIEPGIACQDFEVQSNVGGTGLVSLSLTNLLGYDLKTVKADVENCGLSNVQDLNVGASKKFDISCASPITASKYMGKVTVSYTTVGSGLEHSKAGKLIAGVQ